MRAGGAGGGGPGGADGGLGGGHHVGLVVVCVIGWLCVILLIENVFGLVRITRLGIGLSL